MRMPLAGVHDIHRQHGADVTLNDNQSTACSKKQNDAMNELRISMAVSLQMAGHLGMRKS
jgi:hypothetical protein